jgi:hypothetical protein
MLLVFSATNLYVSNSDSSTKSDSSTSGAHAYIYIILVGTCFFVFLGICTGHIWCKIKGGKSAEWSEHPGREHHSHWHRGRVREEGEETMGQVTMSTAGINDTTLERGRRDSVFRESVLELSLLTTMSLLLSRLMRLDYGSNAFAPRGTTRVEISYAYGQKSIEISWKSREISEKWKSEIKLPCAHRFSAPSSSVDCSKLQGRPCCGARTPVPAGRPHPRETEKCLP